MLTVWGLRPYDHLYLSHVIGAFAFSELIVSLAFIPLCMFSYSLLSLKYSLIGYFPRYFLRLSHGTLFSASIDLMRESYITEQQVTKDT